MQTVESIIKSVYGDEHKAAAALSVKRTAVSNWKAWGKFPARLLGPICEHAREKRVKLNIADIPITDTAIRFKPKPEGIAAQ